MRIRKTKAVLLSLLTFLLLPTLAQLATAQQMPTPVASTQVPTLFVHPSPQIVEQGQVFTIDISIANVTDLNGFDFKLGYNTTLLDALDAEIGSFPQPINWGTTEIHEQDGYVLVSVISEQAVDGSGILATITFEVTQTGCLCELYTLDLYDTELLDSTAAPITHDVQDGCYLVGSLVPEFPATIVIPLLLTLAIAAAFLGKMVWARTRVRSPVEP